MSAALGERRPTWAIGLLCAAQQTGTERRGHRVQRAGCYSDRASM